jgi:hypothetical protein
MLNKLDDSSEYFVFFAYDDSMDEKSIAELYNNIIDGGDLSSSGVTKLGTIRRKYPQSGNFENYSVFAIKA